VEEEKEEEDEVRWDEQRKKWKGGIGSGLVSGLRALPVCDSAS
jgi:hypothetical protein